MTEECRPTTAEERAAELADAKHVRIPGPEAICLCLEPWPCLRRRLIADVERQAPLVEELVGVLEARCEHHNLPLEYEPQGDAHLPLVGWNHPVQMQPNHHNKTGIVYASCALTDSERDLLRRVHQARGKEDKAQ